MSDLPTLFAHEHAPSTAITQPAATTAAAAPDPPSRPLPAPADWPQPPDNVALTGLAGDIVAAIAPNTEADPIAILAQLLVAFGAAVGRGAWFEVEATRHHPHEFVVLVGDSARARKGSSWDHVARLIEHADPAMPARISTGLASGEGLVWAVRDPTGKDPGTPDRRLLVIEPEFASVLKAANRDQSTLSPVLRCAWDGRPLALLTRTAPARATDAHISVIGHITTTELCHHVHHVELANGFLNRFLLFACRRVRLLPDGGHPDPLHGTDLRARLARHLTRARAAGHVRLQPAARELWHDAYIAFADPPAGLAGHVTARAEAHTIRLALLYTLIDGNTTITATHLQAALALHDYAARSASWALANTPGDPLANAILTALQQQPRGLTRTQIRDLFNRNQPAARVDQALATLARDGKARHDRVITGGRPADRWTATPTR
jgi:hypothetical protein